MNDTTKAKNAQSRDNTGYVQRDLTISMMDGTRLAVSRYDLEQDDQDRPTSPPLLCIPPELGNARYYSGFMTALARCKGAPKKVYILNLRGRGASEADRTPENGTLVDADDLVACGDALGLHHADVLVTGRSAFALIMTGPKRPGFCGRLILNDAAPEFDAVGIAREATVAKRIAVPKSWADAAASMKSVWGEEFTAFGEGDWLDMARCHWSEDNGHPVPGHHGDLERWTNIADYDARQPALWEEFRIFQRIPTLMIRGEHSSLVSTQIADRVTNMQQRVQQVIAAGQGHAPLLHVGDLTQKVAKFLSSSIGER